MANLKPNTNGLIKFTSETASYYGKRGGIKSAETRKRRAEQRHKLIFYLKVQKLSKQLTTKQFKDFLMSEYKLSEDKAKALALMFNKQVNTFIGEARKDT